jgi:hypothetical protein
VGDLDRLRNGDGKRRTNRSRPSLEPKADTNPEEIARRESKQTSPTDSITGNQTPSASNGPGGLAGSTMAPTGGSPSGASGKIVGALNGSTSTFEQGLGGGIATFGTATADTRTLPATSPRPATMTWTEP